MLLLDFLKENLHVNIDVPEWKSTILQMKVNMKLDPNEIDCTGGIQCKVTMCNIMEEVIFSDREAYVFSYEKGFLILGPSKSELPLIAIINKRHIKSIESRTKFTKMIVTIKTDDNLYDFKTAKKDGSAMEKLANSLRNT